MAALTPREAFDRFRHAVLSGELGISEEHCADDVVVEIPFAHPGMPNRLDGIDAFRAFAAESREALPLRFEEFRNVVVHDTTDPEVIVAEYELVATHMVTGRQASAPFVLVLRVRDGKVVTHREYQNPLVIAQALAS